MAGPPARRSRSIGVAAARKGRARVLMMVEKCIVKVFLML